MKKIFLIITALILLNCVAGCESSGSQIAASAGGEAPTAAPAIYACEEPIQFESEEAFIAAIKTAGENEVFHLKDIKYYYRPKNVPEGAILKYVQVYYTYVMFAYTLDTDKKSMDYTKNINLAWYKDYTDTEAYLEDSINRMGGKMVSFEGQDKSMKISGFGSFSEGKTKSAKGEISAPTWDVQWVQEGACFAGTIPWTISEKQIAKYLEMEKVVIE
jgi:hypothetical protein